MMRNKTFVDMAKLFKVELKHLRKFHIDQLERCRELLIDATKAAAKSENGKPVFYTSLKRATRSGRTQAISIHYFNDVSGEMHSLNYVASILLNLRLDEQERYVIVRASDFRNGKSLIWALSKWLAFGKRQRTDHIVPKEL
ncbi:hypothetical protein [Parasphingorhabdus sp.]|uniref:hypothetical protein n=1 Tax=Parasphingorhabdus sp. TaxID=2709688 RepID=UPI003D2D9311